MCNAEDFWLGLKRIQSIAQQGVYILRIDLEDWKDDKHWTEYSFSLEGPSKDYTLHVSHLSGNLPDGIANSTGVRFSTKDRNYDNHPNSDCARNYTGKVQVQVYSKKLIAEHLHVKMEELLMLQQKKAK